MAILALALDQVKGTRNEKAPTKGLVSSLTTPAFVPAFSFVRQALACHYSTNLQVIACPAELRILDLMGH